MVGADIRPDDLIDELQPVLRGFLRESGMPADVVHNIRLIWNGAAFSITSAIDITDYEFGDGKGPAPRPIHKALNRLGPEMDRLLQNRLLEQASMTVSPW